MTAGGSRPPSTHGARDTAAAFLAALAAGDGPVAARVLVLAAHPDDEVIGLGGQLARLREAWILHVTDGAPRDGRDAAEQGFATPTAYAAARRRELDAALRLAGRDPARSARCLGVPDQQAALRLEWLARAVAAALRALRPGVVVTHPYEGGHPDHDATAFAAHAALRLLDGHDAAPALVEMTSYHAAQDGGIAVGRFLPAPAPDHEAVALPLTPAARVLKRRMIGCFATQRDTLAWFPVGTVEWLRPAPPYRFREPPHAGRLFYENFPWGMTGARFRALAAQAQDALGIGDGAWR